MADIPVRVAVRVRPTSTREKSESAQPCVVCFEEQNQVSVNGKMFAFDNVFIRLPHKKICMMHFNNNNESRNYVCSVGFIDLAVVVAEVSVTVNVAVDIRAFMRYCNNGPGSICSKSSGIGAPRVSGNANVQIAAAIDSAPNVKHIVDKLL
uniref:Kinesin motor domain-containing protein n=1 Tax=Ascaris lumbricoides TaxID=6252 RepID=A0A0M3I880_ASCLU